MRSSGRPSGYSEGMASAILERLTDGESLRAICQSDGMPRMSTVMTWLAKYEGFQAHYARAREIQEAAIFDEMDRVARDALDDQDKVNGARLFIDTQKWRLGKMSPKKYGDKLNLDHSGQVDLKQVPIDDLRYQLAQLRATDAGSGSTQGDSVERVPSRVRK